MEKIQISSAEQKFNCGEFKVYGAKIARKMIIFYPRNPESRAELILGLF